MIGVLTIHVDIWMRNSSHVERSWDTLTSESFGEIGVCLYCPQVHTFYGTVLKKFNPSPHPCIIIVEGLCHRGREGERVKKGRQCVTQNSGSRVYFYYVFLNASHIVYYMAYILSHSFQFPLWAIEAIFHMVSEQFFHQGGMRNYSLELEGCRIRL